MCGTVDCQIVGLGSGRFPASGGESPRNPNRGSIQGSHSRPAPHSDIVAYRVHGGSLVVDNCRCTYFVGFDYYKMAATLFRANWWEQIPAQADLGGLLVTVLPIWIFGAVIGLLVRSHKIHLSPGWELMGCFRIALHITERFEGVCGHCSEFARSAARS